jgi:hypothetical protein
MFIIRVCPHTCIVLIKSLLAEVFRSITISAHVLERALPDPGIDLPAYLHARLACSRWNRILLARHPGADQDRREDGAHEKATFAAHGRSCEAGFRGAASFLTSLPPLVPPLVPPFSSPDSLSIAILLGAARHARGEVLQLGEGLLGQDHASQATGAGAHLGPAQDVQRVTPLSLRNALPAFLAHPTHTSLDPAFPCTCMQRPHTRAHAHARH